MKKIITWVLLLAMVLGLFAGCKKQEPDTPPVVDAPSVSQAMEYVKALYPNEKEAKKTAVDYVRMGVVRINNVPFTVTWTVDVSEDFVKIVVNNDGTVTFDVNEECKADTPYTLTATITDGKGEKATHTWNYIVPKAADMGEIVDAAYALQPGEIMDHAVTLTGEVLSVKTPYDPSYKNITVIIEVAARPGKTIECYRLKGEGVENIAIGDTITVTGTLKNYNGTIEFDAGCICDSIVPGERVEAPTDMKEIVDAAYALEANKSLPYEAVLTGTITQIGTAYNAQYGNVTVTIVVEGREDKPIVCYRLKGDNADKIGVNDIITVSGYITNFVGEKGHSTIEFTAGCQLVKWEDKAGPEIPNDPKVIVDQAYKLGANEALKYEATLTGKITKVGTAYDATYGNVTVTMVIDGREDKPIVCYRMKGDGVDVIDIGDVITVKGYIKNYVGDAGYSTIEFDYPTLDSYKKSSNVAPSDPVKIVKDAYALAPNAQLPYKATLTGVITKVKTAYDASFKNVTVIIEVDGTNDMPITCYRLKGDGADKIGVGDTITVSGYITNYKHTSGDTEVEFTAGCTLDKWTAGTDKPEEPDVPVTPPVDDGAMVVELPVAGTAYKFGMFQNDASLKKNFYFKGSLSGNYLATTDKAAEAVDVYLEAHPTVTGAAYLYFMNGEVKTYIAMEEYKASGKNYYSAKAVFTTEAPSVYYTWNEDLKTIVCNTGNDTFCFGTHSTYTTISCSSSYYFTGDNAAAVDNTQYIGRFYTVEITDEPENPDTPDTPDVPDEPATNEIKLTVDSLGLADQSYSAGTNTVGGVAFEWIQLGNYGNGIQVRDKDGKTSSFWNTAAFSKPIKEIRLVFNTAKSTYDNLDAEIFSFGNEAGNYTYSTKLSTVAGTKEYVITPDAETYTFFKFEHDVGYTFYWDSITIVLAGEGATEPEEPDTPVEPEEPATNEIKLTVDSLGLESQKYTAGTNTVGGVAFEWIQLGNYGNGIQVRDKDGNTSVFWNTSAFSKPIKEIRLVFNTAKSTYDNPDAEIFSFGNEAGNYTYTAKLSTVAGTKEYVITPDAETYTFFKFEHDVGYTFYWDSITIVLAGEGGTTPNPDPTPDPDVPVEDEEIFIHKFAETLEQDKGYLLYMEQVTLGKELYFNGTVSGGFLGTTENADEAVYVFAEAVEGVEGAVRFYFMDGEAKTYIEGFKNSSNKIRLQLVTTATEGAYFTYNEELGVYTTDIEGTAYYMGSYSNFGTFSLSKTSYISGDNAENVGVSQFIGRFAELISVIEDIETVTPPLTEGEAYFLFMEQVTLDKTLYFNGTVSGGFLGTTENADEAVYVFAEAVEGVEGAVRFYFMDGEAKTYIEGFKNSSNKIRLQLVTTATEGAYFTYNEELGVYTTDIEGTAYYMGSYSNFGTFSLSKTSYISGDNAENVGVSQFISQYAKQVYKQQVATGIMEEGSAYKLTMDQVTLGKTLYFKGTVTNGFLDTTEEMTEAVDVWTEAVEGVEGAVRFYFMDGEAKTYIEGFKNSSNKIRLQLVTTATEGAYFTYNEELGVYTTDIEGTAYYMGSYSNFGTFSLSKTSYISGDNAENVGVTQFVSYYTGWAVVE